MVEAGTLKHEDKGENENTQPLLALDWTPSHPVLPTSPTLSGISHQEAHVKLTTWLMRPARHKGLLSCHPVMTVTSHWSEQPKLNKDLRDAFLFFNEGTGRWSKVVMETRLPPPHIYGIKWIEKRKTKFEAHTSLGQRFFWGFEEMLSSFCSLKLSAFPSRSIRI